MQCLHCGNQLLDGATSCPNCGAPVEASNMQGQFNPYGQPNQFNQGQFYGQQGQNFGQKLTKKEFLKLPSLKKCKGNLNGAAILCYFCAACTLLVAVLMQSYLAILDVLLILGMGLGIQLAQSRVCAVILFVYSIYNLIIALLSSGTPSGWIIIVAGILAIIYTFKFQKAWKEYNETGMMPPTV